MNEQENQAKPVTVEELDNLLAAYKEKDAEKAIIAEQLKEKNKELIAIEGRVTAYLKELGRDNFDSPFGKCELFQDEYVKMPDGPEEKGKLFAWMREHEIFDKYATVNSNSLNALFFRERASAVEQGADPMTWTLPGLTVPTIHERSKIKVKK